jgi:2-methylcitrate dehydratase PrpD
MTAVGLIKGTLTAADYEDEAAADPRIDALREKMEVVEDPRYSRDYLDPAKRSIANAVQVFFKDGTSTEKVEVEYPLGHRRRRMEAVPLLDEKFSRNASRHFPPERIRAMLELFHDPARLEAIPVHEFVDALVVEKPF